MKHCNVFYYSFIAMTILLFAVANKLQCQLQNTNELPFVILICAYNNAPWVVKNLDSVRMQKYTNYRIIYIDDASKDATVEELLVYIEKYNLQNKVSVVTNKQRARKLANVYNAIHDFCYDHEIVVQLDADDWFEHDCVLQTINKTYSENNIWLTYGQFKNYPSGTKGWAIPVPENIIDHRLFRTWKWVYAAPRTFYAWLFKQIALDDLITEKTPGFEGKFFPVANDVAMMVPMLEMAHTKFAFIPEIAYVTNRANVWSSNNFSNTTIREVQQQATAELRARPIVYTPLADVPQKGSFFEKKADVCIFSQDPEQLAFLLSSLQSYVQNVHTITIICNNNNSNVYHDIQKLFPHVSFIFQETANYGKAMQYIESYGGYILLLDDQAVINKALNMHEEIKELERTRAYVMYYGITDYVLQKSQIPTQHINKDIYALKFSCMPADATITCHMALYRKKDTVQRLQELHNTGLTITQESMKNFGIGLGRTAWQ